MEQSLLRTNKSYFFPVTSSTFVSVLLNGIRTSVSPSIIANLIESCQFNVELAACQFIFCSNRASTIAVAAIVVTLETQRANLSPEVVSSCLASIKANIDYTKDAAIQDCVEKLRSIHNRNEQRIRDMENKSTDDEVAKYTSGKEAHPNASRAATPSPTDPCQQNQEEVYSNGSRKRRRRSSPSMSEIV